MGTLLNSFWFSPPPPPPPVSPVIPPVTPVIPPVTPVIPPVTPVIPPVSPVIPPVSPVIPPVSPVIPPVSPVIPPVSPVIPPVSPVIPPATLYITYSYCSGGVKNGYTCLDTGGLSVSAKCAEIQSSLTYDPGTYNCIQCTGYPTPGGWTPWENLGGACGGSPVTPVIPPVSPVIPPVSPVIPPVSPVIPPVSPVTPPGGCPVGTCPWYGCTCTATDAYWTGCALGSCDMCINHSGTTCTILCSSDFC
jgi:hypothetical protein